MKDLADSIIIAACLVTVIGILLFSVLWAVVI